MSEFTMTPEERAWMAELDGLGAQRGVEGFPMPPAVFEWNCFLEDYRAGLTPLEAIDRTVRDGHDN